MRTACIANLLLILSLTITVATAAEGTVRWDFGSEETMPLNMHGNVARDQAGPRPPEFPDMSPHNTAVRVDAGAYLSIPDSGTDSDFDFENGDPITLEAWVSPTDIRDGEPRYIIGKGRTNLPGFARDNQNWALRITGSQGEAKVNFLFATKPSSGDKHWHRWTSTQGFPVNTGWHHVAIRYVGCDCHPPQRVGRRNVGYSI